MLTRERLKELLALLPNVDAVHVFEDRRKYMVIVIASRFEGIEDHARQSEVWNHLLARLSNEDVAKVDFIVTDTPEELRAIEAWTPRTSHRGSRSSAGSSSHGCLDGDRVTSPNPTVR